MKDFIKTLSRTCLFIPVIFLVLPSSTNYKLDSFGFGAGGEASVSSANYSLEAVLGEISGNQSSTNFGVKSGLLFLQEANVPTVTLVNSSNWYNKLKVTIGIENNPTDATYAIAISDDNFVTTEWVQDDNTIADSLGPEDYQTYAAWGGASGENIINLSSNTTYKVKAKVSTGQYTESGLGPEASAATSPVSLSFDIDISATDSESAAPYTVNFGELTLASVNTASDKIWIDLTTNAENGGLVYIYGSGSGLSSSTANYTITSATEDLAVDSEGFGIREDSTSNLTFVSPYNVSGDNVGVIDTTIREIINSSFAPVVSGRASMLIKVKPSSIAPAASDYTGTLTIIATANF